MNFKRLALVVSSLLTLCSCATAPDHQKSEVCTMVDHTSGEPGLDRDEISCVINRDAASPLRTCYEDALKKNADLTSRLTTKFIIHAGGDVDQVSVDPMPSDANFANCIKAQMAVLKFPAHREDVKVAYPLFFKRVPGESAHLFGD